MGCQVRSIGGVLPFELCGQVLIPKGTTLKSKFNQTAVLTQCKQAVLYLAARHLDGNVKPAVPSATLNILWYLSKLIVCRYPHQIPILQM